MIYAALVMNLPVAFGAVLLLLATLFLVLRWVATHQSRAERRMAEQVELQRLATPAWCWDVPRPGLDDRGRPI